MSALSIFVIVASVVVAVTLFFVMISMWIKSYNSIKESSQIKITDKELILLIENQPDGFVSKAFLIKNTPLDKKEVNIRLQELSYKGIVKYAYSNKFKYYYSLKESGADHKTAELSDVPFLTIEDLFELFELHDNRLTLQKVCLSTGLPLSIIDEQLKYFIKEDIILKLSNYENTVAQYILSEKYKKKGLDKLEENEINLDLSKIVEKLKMKNQ